MEILIVLLISIAVRAAARSFFGYNRAPQTKVARPYYRRPVSRRDALRAESEWRAQMGGR